MDGIHFMPRRLAALVARIMFLSLIISLSAGCVREQPPAPADPPPLVYDPDYEPSPTPLPGPTETPGADEVGKGLIHIWQINYSEAHGDKGEFEMRTDIPFKVYYNGKTRVWEAVGQSTRADGMVSLTTKAANCHGLFTGMSHMKGTLIPPNTLIADPEGCKLVAHFTQYWDEVVYKCDTIDNFSEPASVHFRGPITFNLEKGDVQMESFDTGVWSHTYYYEIKALDLPFSTECKVIDPEPVNE